MTHHSSFLVSCMHASYKTSSEMLNAEFIFKGQEIWETNGKLELVPWRTPKKNLNTISERWKSNWPDWQVCLKIWQFILEARHPCQIDRSLDHSSKLRAICRVELIAPACGNQRSQLHLLSWQCPDLSISQATQGANRTDKRRPWEEKTNGICHNGFLLDLEDYKNKNGVATDLFCTGVIGHSESMFLN